MRGMVAVLAWLALAIVGADAQTLRLYANARFGTTAATPSDWTMGPAPENDDGRVFTSPDGDATITISGMLMISSPAEEIAERSQAGEGETITYKAVNRNIIVVSGLRGGRIFYRKSLLACGVWNDVSIEYPVREKALYDGLVARVAASLHGGRGYQNPNCA